MPDAVGQILSFLGGELNIFATELRDQMKIIN